jgi:hypothetical protein
MDPIRNPFAPGAGTRPPAFVGREKIIQNTNILLARVQAGRAAKSMLFVGLRGVGKTVLLNYVKKIAEDDYGYKTIFIETPEDKSLASQLVPNLLRLLREIDLSTQVHTQVKRALRGLRSFAATIKVRYEALELGIEPERGLADSGDLETDLASLLVAVAEAAAAKKTPCLLLIDEIQYLSQPEFRALITAMHRVAQQELPFVLVGAGLPQLVGVAGEAKSYAERLFDYPLIGALSEADAATALQEPVKALGASYTDRAISIIYKYTKGYPYFIQEWGFETWNQSDSPIITDLHVTHTIKGVMNKLDDNFFRVRLDRLTPTEKNYLRAMAELGPGAHRSGDIAAILNKKVNAVAPVRNSLIRKGMIYSPGHGDTEFTVPLFDEFMKRVIPELMLPLIVTNPA